MYIDIGDAIIIIWMVFGVGFTIWWVGFGPISKRGARRNKLEREEREREREKSFEIERQTD